MREAVRKVQEFRGQRLRERRRNGIDGDSSKASQTSPMDKKTQKRKRRPVGMRGGRPKNELKYPQGTAFDAQAFRFALADQGIGLRDLVARLDIEYGMRVHRSTVWRWTQYRLYPTGSAPPLLMLRAAEHILGVKLLKDASS